MRVAPHIRERRFSLLVLVLCMSSLVTPAFASEHLDQPSEEPAQLNTDSGEPDPLVYNGETIDNPGWVVSLTISGSYACSGTLVHAQWVLTAAHCVDDADSSFRMNVGGDQWFSGTQRSLKSVRIHPGYDAFDLSSVDLAMVQLGSPVSAPLPRLVSNSSWPVIDQVLVVVGWGLTHDGSPVPNDLQGAGVFVNSDTTGLRNDYDDCNVSWVAASGFEDFCFGGYSWACSGDSGGPLIGRATPDSTEGAVDTIYGLTSFGDASGCSSATWDTVGQAIGPHVDWVRSFIPVPGTPGPGDEMFFYRTDGLYRFYDIDNDARLSKPIRAGDNYTHGWSSIAGLDLDGDGQDEMFFYRDDGLYRFYDVRADGSLGTPLKSGDNFTRGWTSIAGVDLEGDGQDEMFFYRDDGLYRFYDVKADGSIGKPLSAGDEYTKNWTTITSLDLDGDGQDEMFFYRNDGLYRYYHIRPDGTLPKPINGGDNYTRDWSSISAVDLEGDGQDEMFFYREDGLYRYYNVRPDGSLPKPMNSGDNYTKDWTSITSVNLAD